MHLAYIITRKRKNMSFAAPLLPWLHYGAVRTLHTYLCKSTRMLGRRFSFWAPNLARALTAAATKHSSGQCQHWLLTLRQQASTVYKHPTFAGDNSPVPFEWFLILCICSFKHRTLQALGSSEKDTPGFEEAEAHIFLYELHCYLTILI